MRYLGFMQNDDEQTGGGAGPMPADGKAGMAGREAQRQAEARKARAAKTLRDNLLRRKQQGRARRAGAEDETSGLPAAKTDQSAE